MILKKFLFVFMLLLVVITFSQKAFTGEKDKTPAFQGKNRLVSLIKKVKAGTLAIGTYYFKDSPQLRFRGTGFAVGDGRFIVTNAHTINQVEKEKRLKQLRIFHKRFHSEGIKVSLAAKDNVHDLALLKIESGRFTPLTLGDSDFVEEGEAIALTGYPLGLVLGLNPTTHTGIISAVAPIVLPSPTARSIKKEIIEFLRKPYNVFQIDATAYPGSSGSPVFRISTGEVIGVVNMVFVKGKKEHIISKPTGITYAIPSNFVHALIRDSVGK